MSQSLNLPEDYNSIFSEIKNRVNQARYNSLKTINKELINLYWDLGKILSEKSLDSWGDKVINTFSKDLNIEFPGVKGFSVSNLKYMRQFYTEYTENQIGQQVVGQIPWAHHISIFTKVKGVEERKYYINQSAKFGWSRGVLENKIKNNEFQNLGLAQNNFEKTIDENKLSIIRWEQKDEYNLSFLELSESHSERELEDAIVSNIIKFMGELGSYFCFMGRQFRIVTESNKEYFLDLLFYHRKLKCLVVIELKTVEFQAEFSGKMALYLNHLDDKIKEPDENPSIGIIICQIKDRLDVEYSIKDISKPIGVSQYISEGIPNEISKYLPTKNDLINGLKKQ